MINRNNEGCDIHQIQVGEWHPLQQRRQMTINEINTTPGSHTEALNDNLDPDDE